MHAETFAPMVDVPDQMGHEVPNWAASFCSSREAQSVPDGSNMEYKIDTSLSGGVKTSSLTWHGMATHWDIEMSNIHMAQLNITELAGTPLGPLGERSRRLPEDGVTHVLDSWGHRHTCNSEDTADYGCLPVRSYFTWSCCHSAKFVTGQRPDYGTQVVNHSLNRQRQEHTWYSEDTVLTVSYVHINVYTCGDAIYQAWIREDEGVELSDNETDLSVVWFAVWGFTLRYDVDW